MVGQLKSTSKIFAVLETLCTNGDVGVSDLSRKLNLGKSSVHRFLSVLRKLNYAEKDQNSGKYFATLKLFEIGAMVRGRNRLVNIARPYMEELGNRFHETVNLAFFDGSEVVYVDKVESIHTLRMDLAIGRRAPAYCTALGKVFLACQSEQDLERYCRETRFKPLVENTITSAKQFIKHLETVRRDGVAIDDRELDKGIRCMAAPIRDDSGRVVAAISIAGPSSRITLEKLKAFRQPLLETTRIISQRLGYIKV
jgi:DNA-binding IclR family transcriptional regulator